MALHLGEGRPSKFTPERVEAILDALRGGCSRMAAASAGGIHYDTLHDWLAKNPEFLREVEKAESLAEANYTAVVFKAAATNWQAAAWWLERRRFRDYARRDRVDVTVDVRHEAERLASEFGLDAADVLAEAERVLSESR